LGKNQRYLIAKAFPKTRTFGSKVLEKPLLILFLRRKNEEDYLAGNDCNGSGDNNLL